MLIDADNVPVRDPAFLFETAKYRETGALFWPDLKPIPESSGVWDLLRMRYREEPSFESGQLVIDKARCWRALRLKLSGNGAIDHISSMTSRSKSKPKSP